jgi:hypothetical protein
MFLEQPVNVVLKVTRVTQVQPVLWVLKVRKAPKVFRASQAYLYKV